MPYPRLQHFFIDENATALTANEISVRNQLLVAGYNRVSRDIQLLGKLSAGRQLHARCKRPAENTVHELLSNLILQIHRSLRIYVNYGVLHCLSLVHCESDR